MTGGNHGAYTGYLTGGGPLQFFRHARNESIAVQFRFSLRAPGSIVMPGLVPGIHVGPPPGSLPARTAMRQDVDGRNESGHDAGG